MIKYDLTFKIIYYTVFGIVLVLIILQRNFKVFDGMDFTVLLVVAVAFVIASVFFLRKNDKSSLAKTDDEMSLLVKYKSGYYSYIVSLQLWMLLLLFRGSFGNDEALLFIGVIGSAMIGLLSRFLNRRNVGE